MSKSSPTSAAALSPAPAAGVHSEPLHTLFARIVAREARVGVVGLGYVGLPLLTEFARAGYDATGFDLDTVRLAQINRGESYIPDVPAVEFGRLVHENKLRAATDWDQLANMDAISICVPTPLRKTKDPDLSYIANAVEAVARRLRPGQLVVLESTTYPGTTDEVVLPRLQQTGLKVGKDFLLAFSPERVDPGNARFQTANIPKVVGGITLQCTQAAQALYSGCVGRVVPVSSARAAEMAKLLENTFRNVNIGLVNEMALLCHAMDLDVWEVIDAAASKPFGFMAFAPGPGLGGHCIPIDPVYLSWRARAHGFEPRLIEVAQQVNARMPEYVAEMVAAALNDRGRAVRGAAIHILGIAYKKDIADLRESPALDIMHLLRKRGAELRYSDPFIPKLREPGWNLDAVPVDQVSACDCAVIIADHSAFDFDRVLADAPAVVDTRNALKGRKSGKLYRL
ncbi:MAG: nucleotide sugar dehydrogenase [Terriglobales bacterium]